MIKVLLHKKDSKQNNLRERFFFPLFLCHVFIRRCNTPNEKPHILILKFEFTLNGNKELWIEQTHWLMSFTCLKNKT